MRPLRSKTPAERSPHSRTIGENAVRISTCACSSTTPISRFHITWRSRRVGDFARASMLEHLRLRIGGAVQRGVDRIQDAGQILRDVIIPEADNSIAFKLKPARTLHIARLVRLVSML